MSPTPRLAGQNVGRNKIVTQDSRLFLNSWALPLGLTLVLATALSVQAASTDQAQALAHPTAGQSANGAALATDDELATSLAYSISTRDPANSKSRDLGLLTFKAILLGPLIGLTIKGALLRGLLWAVGMYLMHIFAPGLLSTLGLGTGLVGFARQLQPDYGQLLAVHLAQVQRSLPRSVTRLASQYRQILAPLIEALQSIPDGPCRLRAVCETASQVIRNAQYLSATIQRLSASVYLNLGTEYSRAWLNGVVQSDCAAKYAQCAESPLAVLASRLAESVRPVRAP